MTECFNCLAIIIEVTVNNIHATTLSIHCIIQDNLQKQLYIFAEMIPCTYTRTTNCDCQRLHKIKGEKGIPFLLGKPMLQCPISSNTSASSSPHLQAWCTFQIYQPSMVKCHWIPFSSYFWWTEPEKEKEKNHTNRQTNNWNPFVQAQVLSEKGDELLIIENVKKKSTSSLLDEPLRRKSHIDSKRKNKLFPLSTVNLL